MSRRARSASPEPLPQRKALVGFYNDYSAEIGKDVVTPLFHPENHPFDVRGRLRAFDAVGHGCEYRVPKTLKQRVLDLVPRNLRAVLVDHVLSGRDQGETALDAELLRTTVLRGGRVLR